MRDLENLSVNNGHSQKVDSQKVVPSQTEKKPGLWGRWSSTITAATTVLAIAVGTSILGKLLSNSSLSKNDENEDLSLTSKEYDLSLNLPGPSDLINEVQAHFFSENYTDLFGDKDIDSEEKLNPDCVDGRCGLKTEAPAKPPYGWDFFIKTYHPNLEDSPKFSEKVKIDDRLISHVIGDSFSKGSEWEGSHLKTTLRLLYDFVKTKSVANPDYAKFELKLRRLLAYSSDFKQPEDVRSYLSNLQNLERGDGLFLYGGWSNVPVGHAILYEVRKEQNGSYSFLLYNLGAGMMNAGILANVHGEIKGSPLTKRTNIKLENLMDDNWLGLYLSMLKVQPLNLLSHKQAWNENDIYRVLVPMLKGEWSVSSETKDDLLLPQHSGTCAMVSLYAAFFHHVPHDTFYQGILEFQLWSLLNYYDKTVSQIPYPSKNREHTRFLHGAEVLAEKSKELLKRGAISEEELNWVLSELRPRIQSVQSQMSHYKTSFSQEGSDHGHILLPQNLEESFSTKLMEETEKELDSLSLVSSSEEGSTFNQILPKELLSKELSRWEATSQNLSKDLDKWLQVLQEGKYYEPIYLFDLLIKKIFRYSDSSSYSEIDENLWKNLSQNEKTSIAIKLQNIALAATKSLDENQPFSIEQLFPFMKMDAIVHLLLNDAFQISLIKGDLVESYKSFYISPENKNKGASILSELNKWTHPCSSVWIPYIQNDIIHAWTGSPEIEKEFIKFKQLQKSKVSMRRIQENLHSCFPKKRLVERMGNIKGIFNDYYDSEIPIIINSIGGVNRGIQVFLHEEVLRSGNKVPDGKMIGKIYKNLKADDPRKVLLNQEAIISKLLRKPNSLTDSLDEDLYECSDDFFAIKGLKNSEINADFVVSGMKKIYNPLVTKILEIYAEYISEDSNEFRKQEYYLQNDIEGSSGFSWYLSYIKYQAPETVISIRYEHEAREILSLLESPSEQVERTLAYFSSRTHLLKDKEIQYLFNVFLFHEGLIFEALEDPQSGQKTQKLVLQLFLKAFRQCFLLEEIDSALVFLDMLRQIQPYLQESDERIVLSEAKSIMLNVENTFDQRVGAAMIAIASLKSKDTLSFDEQVLFLSSRSLIERHGSIQSEFTSRLSTDLLISEQKHLAGLLETLHGDLGKELLCQTSKLLDPNRELAQWSIQNEEVCDRSEQFVLNTTNLIVKSLFSDVLPRSITKSENYSNLFSKQKISDIKKLPSLGDEDLYRFKGPGDIIYQIGSKGKIFAEFEPGEWFVYLEEDSFLKKELPPYFSHRDIFLWRSEQSIRVTEKDLTRHITDIYYKKDQKAEEKTLIGLSLEKNEKSYFANFSRNNPVYDYFIHFAGDTRVQFWYEAINSSLDKVDTSFPSALSFLGFADGDLRFERNSSSGSLRFDCVQMPGWRLLIDHNQKLLQFPSFTSFLSLENKKGEKRVLISPYMASNLYAKEPSGTVSARHYNKKIKKVQEAGAYYTYNVLSDGTLRGLNLKSNAYLAFILIDHEKYAEAIQILREEFFSSTVFESEVQEILLTIIQHQKDNHPKANAARVLALYTLVRNKYDHNIFASWGEKVKEEGEDNPLDVNEIIEDYLKHLEYLGNCSLKEEEEGFILSWFSYNTNEITEGRILQRLSQIQRKEISFNIQPSHLYKHYSVEKANSFFDTEFVKKVIYSWDEQEEGYLSCKEYRDNYCVIKNGKSFYDVLKNGSEIERKNALSFLEASSANSFLNKSSEYCTRKFLANVGRYPERFPDTEVLDKLIDKYRSSYYTDYYAKEELIEIIVRNSKEEPLPYRYVDQNKRFFDKQEKQFAKQYPKLFDIAPIEEKEFPELRNLSAGGDLVISPSGEEMPAISDFFDVIPEDEEVVFQRNQACVRMKNQIMNRLEGLLESSDESRSIERNLDDHMAACDAYVDLPRPEQFAIKDLSVILGLGLSREAHLAQMKNDLATQEKDLLSLANKKPKKRRENIVLELDQIATDSQASSLGDLFILAAQNNLEAYAKKNPTLTVTELKKLHEGVLNYLNIATAVQKEERILSIINGIRDAHSREDHAIVDFLTQQLVQEIGSKRAYDPAHKPQILILEYFANIQLFSWQVDALETLGIGEIRKRVDEQLFVALELIMGSGKSKILGPLILLLNADGEHLSLAVTTRPLLEQSLQTLHPILREVAGRHIKPFSFSRATPLDSHKLENIYQTFETSIRLGNPILMSPQSMQALFLRLFELAFEYDHADKPLEEVKVNIEGLQKILRLLKEKADLHIDEIHIVQDILTEMNFSLGDKVGLEKNRIRLSLDLFKIIVLDEEVKDKLSHPIIKDGRGPIFTQEHYENVISPLLSEKILDHMCTLSKERAEGYSPNILQFFKNLSSKEKQYLLEFLLWDSKYLEAQKFYESIEDQSVKHFLSLARGQVKQLIPGTLKKKLNWKYGFNLSAESKVDDLAHPYEAEGKPRKNADFGKAWSIVDHTIAAYLQEGLRYEQVQPVIAFLREQAIKELKLDVEEHHAIRAYHYFCGVDVEAGEVATVNLFDRGAENYLLKRCNENPENLLHFIEHYVMNQVKIFPYLLDADGMVLNMMTRRTQGGTGTLGNIHAYAPGMKPMPQSWAMGKTLSLLEEKSGAKAYNIVANSPNELIEQVRGLDPDLKDVNVFTDVGANLSGLSSEHRARILLRKLSDMKGVVFIRDGRIVVLERSSQQIRPLEHSQLKPHELATIYGQAECTGTDIPQAASAHAVLLISHQNSLVEIAQAAWRLRGLDKKQKVSIVLADKIVKVIRKTLNLSEEAPVDFYDFLSFILFQDGVKFGEVCYSAQIKKMIAILKNEAYQNMLEFNFDDFMEAYRATFSLFFKSQQDDPDADYGFLEGKVTGEEGMQGAQNAIIAEHLPSFKNSVFSSHVDIKELEKQIKEAIDTTVLPNKVSKAMNMGSMDTVVEVDTEQEVEQENEIETEIELEIDFELENRLKNRLYKSLEAFIPWQVQHTNPEPWKSGRDELISFSHADSFCPTTKVPEGKGSFLGPALIGADLLFCKDEKLKEYVGVFDPALRFSYNHIHSVTSDPYGYEMVPFKHPLKFSCELLIEHIKETNTIQIAVLDQGDTTHWRALCKNDSKACTARYIYLDGLGIEARGEGISNEELLNHPEFIRLKVQWDFWRGKTFYNKVEREVLEDWVRSVGVDKMRSLFEGHIRQTSHSIYQRYPNSYLYKLLNGKIS